MTNKELLYVEDALQHEQHMKICSQENSKKMQDPQLASYMTELEQEHEKILNKFLNLL